MKTCGLVLLLLAGVGAGSAVAEKETLGAAFARAIQAARAAPHDKYDDGSLSVSVNYDGKLHFLFSFAATLDRDCLLYIDLPTEQATHIQYVLDEDCDGKIDYKVLKGEKEKVPVEGFSKAEYEFLSFFVSAAADSFEAVGQLNGIPLSEASMRARKNPYLLLERFKAAASASTKSLLMKSDVKGQQRGFRVSVNFGDGESGQILEFSTEISGGIGRNCQVLRIGKVVPFNIADDRNCDGGFDAYGINDAQIVRNSAKANDVALSILDAIFGFANVANKYFPAKSQTADRMVD